MRTTIPMKMQITDKDLQQFRERAKTELQSNGAVGRLAWDAVVNALCNEVEELRKDAATGSAALREALVEILDRTNREKARDYDAALNGGILEIHDIANTALNETKGE